MTASPGRTLIKPLLAGFVLGLVFCTGLAIGVGVNWLRGDSEPTVASNQVGDFEIPPAANLFPQIRSLD